ncbi:hypothetical protein PHJA_002172000 [Phtheirospermum japonicum]|uniref:Uncharacterized protein n=1 Tax=Phtheirospermum japonicum TaxID=374723 RepID=A0A830CMS6_9LAMI|nr:hypothetical protein PHJA_002172000 [Phtheirospermum japonicum]
MGGCLSSQSDDRSISRHQKPSANVVSAAGELRQYPLPVTASEILQSQTTSSPPDSFFLCSSDRLYFDDYIPSLNPDDELEPAQIYFILPKAKLQYRLAAVDLAALAVKASVALDQINASNRRRKRKTRISPVSASDEDNQDRQSNQTVDNRISNNINGAKPSAGLGVSRSGSVRKLSRYSSRRAKLAVRSFRNKLSTIYEGTQTFN